MVRLWMLAPPDHLLLLARATQDRGAAVRQALLFIAILIAAVLLGAWLLMLLRRWMLGGSDEGEAAPGTIMTELRDLRETGELSDEQYREAVERLAGRLKGEKQPRESDPDGA